VRRNFLRLIRFQGSSNSERDLSPLLLMECKCRTIHFSAKKLNHTSTPSI